MPRILFASILIAMSYGTANAGWFSYDSYEDCMLGRMKGQTQMMYSAADKACKKEFKVEVWVPPNKIEWKFTGLLILSVQITSSPEYEITKGEFRFSEKSCEETKTNADWGAPIKFEFVGGYGSPKPEPTKIAFFCATLVEVKGIYK